MATRTRALLLGVLLALVLLRRDRWAAIRRARWRWVRLPLPLPSSTQRREVGGHEEGDGKEKERG